MEVTAEAKRIMVVALGKLYSSRSQRGGLRLHRSLLLTMVMKSARDIYHAAQATEDCGVPGSDQRPPTQEESSEPGLQAPLPQEDAVGPLTELHHGAHRRSGAENKENLSPRVRTQSRKRRGKTAAEPDFLPCKKARLEQGLSGPALVLSSVLVDYVNCSSGLAVPPTPLPLHRVVAVC
ncbi:immediate early response gene 2 protein-like [Xyrichtys novacula]|uniref:Immediate early response gene 2 protein-like n=1 Tax=Xyrichtys novacula TaxID=13765 RepID=A0AAV1GSJ4_XYRNO|nr:immediate early response gene 2 protein-like [Xyrichtys novacula]